jgi:hypothetical protein
MKQYIDWYIHQENHKPFKDERLAGYVERRPGHLLKLCMILCASRTNDMTITVFDLERAQFILGQTEIKMPQVFSGMGKNPLASVIHRAMQLLATYGEMTNEQLYTILSNDVDTYRYEQVLATLEASGYAKVIISGKKKIIKKMEGKEPFI